MRQIRNILFFSAFLCGLSFSPIFAQDTATFPKVAEAKQNGVKLYSLYDVNAKPVRDIAPGEFVIVNGQRAGWYQVQVPAGFSCWIFEQYIDLNQEPGLGMVTDNRVNLRAVPSSENNLPLGQVNRGDLLKVLGEKNNWIEVLAPEQTQLWVQSSDLTLLGDPDNYQDALQQQRTQAEQGWRERLSSLAKMQEQKAQDAEAQTLIEVAEKSLAEQRALGAQADYSAVVALFEEAGQKASSQPTKDLIRSRLDYVDALVRLGQEKQAASELEQRKADLEKQAEEAVAKVREQAQERIRFQSGNKLLGRYDQMGWIKRKLTLNRGMSYFLVKGGVEMCEIVCSSERYDLASFLDHEVGVKGLSQRDSALALPRVDVTKLEILAAD